MLFNLSDAWAQSPVNREAAERQTEIKPLQVGDTIPEEVWNMSLQIVNHPHGKDTITLNDYRDKKLIILDFWATWCGACIASFPRMHDLEVEMADRVKVLAITTQSDSVVRNFLDKGNSLHLEKLKANFYSAVNGKYLRQLFKSTSIPHVAVIDQRGVVRARTTPSVLSASNLLDMAQNPFSAPIPMAIEEITGPLLMPTFGERDRPMYYSGLYPFSYTLPYIQHTNVDSLKDITQFFYTNAPVIQLFSAALKYAPDYVNGLATIPSRRIFEVSLPERFDDRPSDENLANWYAYESVNPLGTADEVIRIRMLDDLQFYLGLDAVYEERDVKCLVLRIANLAEVPVNKETGSASQLVIDGRTRGDGTPDGRFEQDVTQKQMPANSYVYNFKPERLAYTLNRTMRLGIPYIIDETGLDDPVNLVLPDNLSNIEDLQRTFLEQGLRLDYENRKLTMFVLKEKDHTPSGKDLVMNTFGYAYGNGEEGKE